MSKTCPTCGHPIKDESILVKYWVKSSWPYSINDKPSGTNETNTIEVALSETYIKNGRRYYKLQSGHGVYTELLVE